MPKLLALVQVAGGRPQLTADPEAPTPNYARVAGPLRTNWGAYLIAGTLQELNAVRLLPTVRPLVVVTETKTVFWPELKEEVSAGNLARINTWLAARALPSFPTTWAWTKGQILVQVFRHFHPGFSWRAFQVKEG